MVHIESMSNEDVKRELASLQARYAALQEKNLSLDLTRGKPCTEQTALSNALEGILNGNFSAADGCDTRNYGNLLGLPEARELFGIWLNSPMEETLVGGNSSLQLMYFTVDCALTVGLRGPGSAWGNSDIIKFLCPVPGYDRHFSVCEHLGIEMIPVRMLETGPDMDHIEALVREDSSIKGMWCVPRFSNPTGCVYSDDTVRRIAALGKLATEHFLVLWDNAYAVHALYDEAPALASIRSYCEQLGTLDNLVQFGSTSKVTFASAGVAFLASSAANIAALSKHLSYQTIGPDKVNQLRHVRFLRDTQGITDHMARHAELIKPKFEAVLSTLERELGGRGMGTWQSPLGGYFIAFDTLPGLAQEVVNLAAAAGVKLTPAGATFPYGKDPDDTNIRLSPTYPDLPAVETCAEVFAVCVQLASLQQRAVNS